MTDETAQTTWDDALAMTASVGFADALIAILDELGWPEADAREALSRAMAAAEPPQKGRVGVDALESMFASAEAALGDPAIGLRAGHRFRVGSHGRTGSVYIYARDLSDVIALNGRYQRLALDLGRIAEVEREGHHRMELSPYFGEDPDARHAYPHTSGALMAAYVTAYRWLNWGSGEDLVSVGLPVPETAAVRQCSEELFRCPVSLDQDVGHLEFTERAMATPLGTADEEKRALSVSILESLLRGGRESESFRTAVRAAIRSALDTGQVTLPVVAGRLDMTESALRRALKQNGCQFRGETDHVRRAVMAERHGAGDSLADIALALGYNDQAAYNRAVKRWYGVAPSQWTPGMPLKTGD